MQFFTLPLQANELFREVFATLLKVNIFDSCLAKLFLSSCFRITIIFEGLYLWASYELLKQAGYLVSTISQLVGLYSSILQPNPTMQVYTLGPSKKYATAYMFTEETRTVYDRQNTTLQAIGEVGFVFLLGRVR